MPVVRATRESIERRKQRIAAWEREIERWDIMKADVDRPAMKALVERLSEAVKAAERDILNLAKNPSSDPVEDRNASLHFGGQLKMAEMILDDIEPRAKKYEEARAKIAILKEEIEEAYSRDGLINKE